MNCQFLNVRAFDGGGNGDVCLAERSDTGATVVIKFLREYHLPHARSAFAREVELLARRLPGVIPLLFADLQAERPYYVMPYLPGGPLTKYIRTLSDTQLNNLALEIGHTIATIHASGGVHGDLKPDNILVTQEGRLQVADPLGNGKGLTVLFSQNHGGTPGYWAPEVSAGGAISQSGDVYSFGATLFELLSAEKPVDGRLPGALRRFSRNAPKIREVIAACCKSNPNDRPSMAEVLRVLNGAAWVDIQADKRRRQEITAAAAESRQKFATAACVVGALVLVGAAIFGDG